jgi:hypothetical protein
VLLSALDSEEESRIENRSFISFSLLRVGFNFTNAQPTFSQSRAALSRFLPAAYAARLRHDDHPPSLLSAVSTPYLLLSNKACNEGPNQNRINKKVKLDGEYPLARQQPLLVFCLFRV